MWKPKDRERMTKFNQDKKKAKEEVEPDEPGGVWADQHGDEAGDEYLGC